MIYYSFPLGFIPFPNLHPPISKLFNSYSLKYGISSMPVGISLTGVAGWAICKATEWINEVSMRIQFLFLFDLSLAITNLNHCSRLSPINTSHQEPSHNAYDGDWGLKNKVSSIQLWFLLDNFISFLTKTIAHNSLPFQQCLQSIWWSTRERRSWPKWRRMRLATFECCQCME